MVTGGISRLLIQARRASRLTDRNRTSTVSASAYTHSVQFRRGDDGPYLAKHAEIQGRAVKQGRKG